MKKIKLRISQTSNKDDKHLMMDEYVKFISFMSVHFKKKLSKKDELALRVNVPFSIR